ATVRSAVPSASALACATLLTEDVSNRCFGTPDAGHGRRRRICPELGICAKTLVELGGICSVSAIPLKRPGRSGCLGRMFGCAEQPAEQRNSSADRSSSGWFAVE